ncbi:MAG: sugar phosphate isomerase/epimerase [Planctomycetia bacterium]|nr:sugar phosphate isomerase/epimerase [Planctomycetia bacterium]
MSQDRLTRRRFSAAALGAGVAGLLGASGRAGDAPRPTHRYKVAACDWMLLKRQKLGAFALSKDCGMDGVEVDMGSLGNRPAFENALLDPAVRRQFLDASKVTGVEICSLAMSAFYGQSFADHPNADRFVDEWTGLMKAMGVRVGFLPFGVKGDVKNDPAVRARFVAALKRAAPKAEAAGVVIGIETNLDADGHKRYLDDVDSPAVRVYYNLGDALENGYDIYKEIGELGKSRICQIHCKEGNVWLGRGAINVPRVKQSLDAIDWSGWLVVERSRVPGKSVRENFSANARYLKSVFQAD